MRCFKNLIQAFLMVAVLMAGSHAYAGFNWGDACAPGDDDFQQDIANKAKVEVGVIPAGKANLHIKLTSPVDVDIQLEDVETGTQIVNYEGGLLSGHGHGCTDYQGLEYCYSGYNGDGSGSGHEYIKIAGTTNRPVKMFAYGYAPGNALVEYSWDAPTDCVDAGVGEEFNQEMAKDNLALVGTIPTGKENVEVKLTSDKDLDIEIYHGDKVIVAYQCKQKTPHFENCLASGVEASVDYEGMTIQYSGWNGVDGKKGHEFVKIEGKLTQPLTIKAFAFEAGTATVNYSWGPKADTAPATPATPVAPCVQAGNWNSGSSYCPEASLCKTPEDAAATGACPMDANGVALPNCYNCCYANCPPEGSSTPVSEPAPAGPATPATPSSSTPDPASYCGPSNVAWDGGINMCIVDPVFTAAKAQCDTDLSDANAANATCVANLSDANAAKAA